MTQKIGVILPLSFGQQPEPPPIWTERRSPVALLRPSVGWLLAARLRNRWGYYYLCFNSNYIATLLQNTSPHSYKIKYTSQYKQAYLQAIAYTENALKMQLRSRYDTNSC